MEGFSLVTRGKKYLFIYFNYIFDVNEKNSVRHPVINSNNFHEEVGRTKLTRASAGWNRVKISMKCVSNQNAINIHKLQLPHTQDN